MIDAATMAPPTSVSPHTQPAKRTRRLLSLAHSYAVGMNRRLAHEMVRAGGNAWEVVAVAPRYFHGDDLRPVRLEAKGDRAAIVLSKAPPATNGATRPSGPSPEVVISARAADVVEWSAAVRSGARRDARRGASPAPSHRRAMGVDGAQRVASRSAHARGGPPRPRRHLTRIGDLKR